MLPRKYALTLEEVVGIILSLFIIVIIVALFVVCRKFRAKRHQSRNGGRNLLIQNEFDKEHIMMKPTRNGVNGAQKLNNLDVARDQDLPLLAQQRPSSISPTVNETHFNYMDTIRHYGAAAEELETLPRIPHDYIQNIQKPVATVAPSMMTDRDMNLKDNYFKRRKSPGPDGARPGSMMSGSGYYRPPLLSVNLPPDGPEPDQCHELAVEDDCQRYHWDCSDWAGAAMVEIPDPELTAGTKNYAGSETSKLLPSSDQTVDPTRDIETLPEGGEEDGDEAGSIASSECESQLGAVYPDPGMASPMVTSPMHQTNKSIEELLMANDMGYADEDNGSVDIPNIYDYKLHLNNYLPTYHLGSDPDTQDEATPMLGRHPGPFPASMTATASPEMARYASIGSHTHAPQAPRGVTQDPEAAARKASAGPLRGLILPPIVQSGQSTDNLCELEDEEEDASSKRAPSPRVTRV